MKTEKFFEHVVMSNSEPFACQRLKIENGYIYTTYDKSHNLMSSVFVPTNKTGFFIDVEKYNLSIAFIKHMQNSLAIRMKKDVGVLPVSDYDLYKEIETFLKNQEE